MSALELLKFDANGLIPAVVQDARTRAVLMLGYMNRQALERTIETGRVTFWSRSRSTYWVKGETSGNYLNVTSIRVNCELNSLLVEVEPLGPTCHEGYQSCYFRRLTADATYWEITDEQIKTPAELYGHVSSQTEGATGARSD
ncbi:MAG: phosphoribosyl-AMP cyclohydrolase [Chthonomonadales bacterium]